MTTRRWRIRRSLTYRAVGQLSLTFSFISVWLWPWWLGPGVTLCTAKFGNKSLLFWISMLPFNLRVLRKVICSTLSTRSFQWAERGRERVLGGCPSFKLNAVRCGHDLHCPWALVLISGVEVLVNGKKLKIKINHFLKETNLNSTSNSLLPRIALIKI